MQFSFWVAVFEFVRDYVGRSNGRSGNLCINQILVVCKRSLFELNVVQAEAILYLSLETLWTNSKANMNSAPIINNALITIRNTFGLVRSYETEWKTICVNWHCSKHQQSASKPRLYLFDSAECFISKTNEKCTHSS